MSYFENLIKCLSVWMWRIWMFFYIIKASLRQVQDAPPVLFVTVSLLQKCKHNNKLDNSTGVPVDRDPYMYVIDISLRLSVQILLLFICCTNSSILNDILTLNSYRKGQEQFFLMLFIWMSLENAKPSHSFRVLFSTLVVFLF